MRTLPSNPKCVVTAVLADRIPAKLHMFKNYDLGTPVHYNDNRRFRLIYIYIYIFLYTNKHYFFTDTIVSLFR